MIREIGKRRVGMKIDENTQDYSVHPYDAAGWSDDEQSQSEHKDDEQLLSIKG